MKRNIEIGGKIKNIRNENKRMSKVRREKDFFKKFQQKKKKKWKQTS